MELFKPSLNERLQKRLEFRPRMLHISKLIINASDAKITDLNIDEKLTVSLALNGPFNAFKIMVPVMENTKTKPRADMMENFFLQGVKFDNKHKKSRDILY